MSGLLARLAGESVGTDRGDVGNQGAVSDPNGKESVRPARPDRLSHDGSGRLTRVASVKVQPADESAKAVERGSPLGNGASNDEGFESPPAAIEPEVELGPDVVDGRLTRSIKAGETFTMDSRAIAGLSSGPAPLTIDATSTRDPDYGSVNPQLARFLAQSGKKG